VFTKNTFYGSGHFALLDATGNPPDDFHESIPPSDVIMLLF
jgi:hypothetical protein